MNLPVKTIVCCLLTLQVSGQSPTPKITLHDAGIGFGFQFQRSENFAEASWEKLPGFHNHGADSTGFSAINAYPSILPDRKAWNLHVHFRLLPNSSFNWIFGVHVLYTDALSAGFSYWRSAETPDPNDVDTSFSYNYHYSADRLSISPRLLVSSDPSKRISGYCGLQLSVGTSLYAQMDTSYEVRGDETNANQLAYGSPALIYGAYGTRRMKQTLSFGVGVPIGITILMGRPGSSWSQLTVSLEGSDGIFLTSVPEMKKAVLKSSFQAGLRLSYRFG